MTTKTKIRQHLTWITVVLGLLLAIKMSLNIGKVYRSGNRIDQAQRELNQAQADQEALKKNLAMVQTPEFIEKEAREKLGLGKPGEVIIIMPKFPSAKYEVLDDKENLANWRKWWNLYVGI